MEPYKGRSHGGNRGSDTNEQAILSENLTDKQPICKALIRISCLYSLAIAGYIFIIGHYLAGWL